MEQDPNFPENPYQAPDTTFGFADLGPRVGEPNPNARVNFDVINDAWELFKAQQWTWVLLGLVYFACTLVIGMGIGMISQVILTATGADMQPGAQPDPGQVALFVFVQIGQQVISAAVGSFFTGGMFIAATKQVRGEPFAVEDLFKAGPMILPLFIATLLVGLAGIAGLLLFIVGVWWIGGRLMLTIPLIVDGRLSATEAMAASWRATRGQNFSAAGFFFVIGILGSIGACACVVGLLVTMPLYYLSLAALYGDFFLSKPKPPALEPEIL